MMKATDLSPKEEPPSKIGSTKSSKGAVVDSRRYIMTLGKVLPVKLGKRIT
jgi:hypothetical protein